jgi:hypothetical protein
MPGYEHCFSNYHGCLTFGWLIQFRLFHECQNSKLKNVNLQGRTACWESHLIAHILRR